MMTDREQRLGGFRLLDVDAPVGEGAQGAVRRAVCERADFPGLSAGMTVALKIIPASDADGDRWQRIESTVRALTALDAPNLVRYYGCFRERSGVVGLHVAVMEFLEGETLQARMARHPHGLDVGLALEIVRSAAAGLGAAAAAGLIHRDVKPGNIFLCADGRVKVIDFGIARHEDATATVGAVPGTPDYMPPEVLMGTSRGSPASDVYALGSCLYEALTGRHLFPRFRNGASGAIEAFVVRARQMRAPKLDAPLVRANPDLARLLQRMTEPDVSRRLSSVAEVEMELIALKDAFDRGEWVVPPPESGEDGQTQDDPCETCDAPTVEDVPTPPVRSPAETPPIPFLSRIIRNRRELFLVIALIVELASNVIIVLHRPRHRTAPDAGAIAAEGKGR